MADDEQISIPGGFLSAINGRRILIGAVLVLVTTCLITQAFVQFAGGPRDEPIDLSDQVSDSYPEIPEIIMWKGLPPFISSGGVFEPEKTIFTIGLSLSGILFVIMGLDFGVRTHRLLALIGAQPWRKVCNILGVVSSICAGSGLVMITIYPFNVALVKHIFFAMVIFYSAFFWVLFTSLSRGSTEDSNLIWKGQKITLWRRIIVIVVFISLILTLYAPPAGYMTIGAFFEWMLLFSAMAGLLSNLPAFDESRTISITVVE